MYNKSLLVIITVVFISCSTSYKAKQTPDDVYYSPALERTDWDSNDSNYVRNDSYDNSRSDYRRHRRNRYVYTTSTTSSSSTPRKTNTGGYTTGGSTKTSASTDPKTGASQRSGNTNASGNPTRTYKKSNSGGNQ